MAETWTINLEPGGGERFTGKLTVDSEKLHFVAMYESSNATIVKNLVAVAGSAAVSGGNVAYLRDSDSELELELPKAEIIKVETAGGFFGKKVVVTMQTGQRFAFNYGMLSVKKLAEAVRA